MKLNDIASKVETLLPIKKVNEKVIRFIELVIDKEHIIVLSERASNFVAFFYRKEKLHMFNLNDDIEINDFLEYIDIFNTNRKELN